jgi:hypothetical protein
VQVTAGLLVSTAISYVQTTWRGNQPFPHNSASPRRLCVVYHPPLHDLVLSSTSGRHLAWRLVTSYCDGGIANTGGDQFAFLRVGYGVCCFVVKCSASGRPGFDIGLVGDGNFVSGGS